VLPDKGVCGPDGRSQAPTDGFMASFVREFPNGPLFSDKPAWLDQIGQPQPTMKIPDSGIGRPCYPGFSDKRTFFQVFISLMVW